MQAISIKQILTLLVALDAALSAAHALSGDAPEQSLALVAVGGTGGGPQHEVMRGRARDGVDERLQGLLVHVHLLLTRNTKSPGGQVRERTVA